MKTEQILIFGEFSFDLDENVLNRNGRPVPIPPRILAILEVLLRNDGRIVDKETLLTEVWAGSFVEESNITYSIRQLRKILDDDFHKPKFIETVPRRGYRFIGSIERRSGDDLPNVQPRNVTGLRSLNFSRSLVAIPVVLCILLGVGLIFGLRMGSDHRSPILARSLKITSLPLPGNISHVAISPNGKLIAYSSIINEQQSVWLKNIETAESKEIIPSSRSLIFGLVFSPDSEDLFITENKNGEEKAPSVFRYTLFSGSYKKILENVQGWIAISPDGSKFSFVRYQHEGENYCGLWIADISGQNQRRLVSRPFRIDIGDNEWSADGRKIYFANGHANNASQLYGVSEVDVETGNERHILENAFFHIKNLQVSKVGQLLIAGNLKYEEPSKIWNVNLKTGNLVPLMDSGSSFAELSANSDETRMVSIVRDNDFRIHLYDLRNPSSFQILTFALSASFRNDGRIVFSSMNNDNSDVYSIRPDGGDLTELTRETSKERFPITSDDGRFVFFTSNRTGEDHLWRTEANGSNAVQITKTVGGYAAAVDNEFVYYRRTLDSTLWKASIDGGGEQQVSGITRKLFRFSHDKKKVAYFDRRGEEVRLVVDSLVESESIASFPLAEDTNAIDIAWAGDGKSLYYVQGNKTEGYFMWKQEIVGSKPVRAANLGKLGIGPHESFSISPDGNSFILVRGEFRGEAVLIEARD